MKTLNMWLLLLAMLPLAALSKVAPSPLIHDKFSSPSAKFNTLKIATASSGQFSNANNFKGGFQSSVDPRTGTLSCSINVARLDSNLGKGPLFALSLSYMSGATANIDGIAQGWSWNIAHYNRVTHALTTSAGRTFLIKQRADGSWGTVYHKLKDMIITGTPITGFTVTLKTGLRETLSPQGYLTKIEEETGHWIKFYYIQLGEKEFLDRIIDEYGNTIKVTRRYNHVDVKSVDANGHFNIFTITTANNEVHRIFLPTLSTANARFDAGFGGKKAPLGFTFYYERGYMDQIIYPSGAADQYKYDFQAGQKDLLYLTANGYVRDKPVVIKHIIELHAGDDTNAPTVTYKYDAVNISNHNYLAFGSLVHAIPNIGSDVLFDTSVKYRYRTAVDNGKTTTIRTYDKYHLVVDQKIISDTSHLPVQDIQKYYCSDIASLNCNRLTFNQLPASYAFPVKTVKKVWDSLHSGLAPLVMTSYARYDDSGNLLKKIDDYGRTLLFTYCPVKGDASCPAVSLDWPFSVLKETVTYVPAPSNAKEVTYHDKRLLGVRNTVLELKEHNIYEKLPNLSNSGYTLQLKHHTVYIGGKQIITTYNYFMDPDHPLMYGFPKEEKTLDAGNKTQLLSILNTLGYREGIHAIDVKTHYQKNFHEKGMLSTGTIQALFSSNKTVYSLVTMIHSRYNGALLSEISNNKKIFNVYHYDHWGRITEKDIYDRVASNLKAHLIHATKIRYLLSANINQKILINTSNIQVKVVYDGGNRPIAVYRQATHRGQLVSITNERGTTHADGWMLLRTNTYDLYGELKEITRYSGLDAKGRPIILHTHMQYNVLGQRVNTMKPDGTSVHTLYIANKLCVVRYTANADGMDGPVTVTNTNVLGHIIRSVHYPQGIVIPDSSHAQQLCQLTYNAKHQGSVSLFRYDRFGRLRQAINAKGDMTQKQYDIQGHLTDVIDPNGNKIHYEYNMLGNIISKTLAPKAGGDYPIAAYRYNVMGKLIEKFIESAVGSESTLHPFYFYRYNNSGELIQVKTPNGHVFDNTYDMLGHLVEKDIDGKVALKRTVNTYGQVMKRVDNSGSYIFSYNTDGSLASVHHEASSLSSYTLHWNYNDYGQATLVSNIDGESSHIALDSLGRPMDVDYVPYQGGKQKIITHYQYDKFGRPLSIIYGDGLMRHITYNRFWKFASIQDTMQQHAIYSWHFHYDKLGNIIRKDIADGKGDRANEHYQYDAVNNLTQFICQSTGTRSLCPRDVDIKHANLLKPPIIRRQDYTFTPLNTMRTVQEVLVPLEKAKTTLHKTIHYYYNSKNYGPLRLKNYSVQWGNTTPYFSHAFIYDHDGNITVDGQGDHMTYNATDQVVSYASITGKRVRYTYDGLGREISEHYQGMDSTIFYRPGGQRINEQRTQKGRTHTIGYFGAMETIDGTSNRYMESDYKGDVVQLFVRDSSGYHSAELNVYSPYGMQYNLSPTEASLLTKNVIGFDGQRTDSGTQWQMLGNGHRAYNPVLKHFMTEDPILEGYSFGNNNPIMNVDPSGNLPQLLGKIMQYVSIGVLATCAWPWAAAVGVTSIEAQKHPGSKNLRWASLAVNIGAAMCLTAAAAVFFLVAPELELPGILELSNAVTEVFSKSIRVLSFVTLISGAASQSTGIAAQVTKGEMSKILGYVALGFQATAIASGMATVVGMLSPRVYAGVRSFFAGSAKVGANEAGETSSDGASSSGEGTGGSASESNSEGSNNIYSDTSSSEGEEGNIHNIKDLQEWVDAGNVVSSRDSNLQGRFVIADEYVLEKEDAVHPRGFRVLTDEVEKALDVLANSAKIVALNGFSDELEIRMPLVEANGVNAMARPLPLPLQDTMGYAVSKSAISIIGYAVFKRMSCALLFGVDPNAWHLLRMEFL